MSKYNRTYHLPFSPGATSDDKISRNIDSLLGVDIVINETRNWQKSKLKY